MTIKDAFPYASLTRAALFSAVLLVAGCDGATVSTPSGATAAAAQTTPLDDVPTVDTAESPANAPEAPPADTPPASEQPAVEQQSDDDGNSGDTANAGAEADDATESAPAQSDSATTEPAITITTEPLPQNSSGYTPADITDLILVTGQSNALGAETSFDSQLDSPDQRTFAYTSNGWQVANLNQVWDRGWFPRGDPANPPSNNLSLHFGKRVTEMDRNRVVGFILVTAPGQPISHWDPQGEFFNSIRSKVSRAISELPVKSRVDGILWHQGESDGEDDPAYGEALYTVIDAFRSESWYSANLPFICGETATLPVNRQLNRLNSDGNPNTACIAAAGLETKGDDAHFSANALRTIGRRYAERYVAMTP
jgi:hypothetical protein